MEQDFFLVTQELGGFFNKKRKDKKVLRVEKGRIFYGEEWMKQEKKKKATGKDSSRIFYGEKWMKQKKKEKGNGQGFQGDFLW